MANTSTSINVTSVDAGGNKLQKAITDINPNADADKLIEFAQKLNGLTDNTYSNTVKITKQELDTTTPKTQTTLTLTKSSDNPDTLSAATIIADGFAAVNYDCNNRNGLIVITYNDTAFAILPTHDTTRDSQSININIAPFPSEVIDDFISTQQDYFVNGDTAKRVSKTGTIKFYVEETDTHTRSEEKTITINA